MAEHGNTRVAVSTAKSLAAACDEFESYDSLPGVAPIAAPAKAAPKQKAAASTRQPKARATDEATALLERALRLGHDKAGDGEEWLHSSAVKTQMRRMDPSFSEKALGFRSFSDFLKSRDAMAELSETGHERLVRSRES